MIDIIDTIEKFDSLKSEWELLEQNPDLRIFQTYAWCRAAWNECLSIEKGNRLWTLKWSQEGKDNVVIFPFYIDGKGCLRFIMDTHSDICDTIYDGVVKNQHYAYKEAAEAIIGNGQIKSVFLQKMSGFGSALNYFSILLPGCVVNKDHAYSWLTSERTSSFISDQVHLRRKDRDRLKAILRKSDSYKFKVLSIKNGDSYPVETIKALRAHMVGWRRPDTSFLSDKMIAFMGTIYNAGYCEIPVLEDDYNVHVLAFRLLKGTRIQFWIVLYLNQHLTTELYTKYMAEKSAFGPYIFDFGVGAYGYKIGTYRPELGVTLSLRYAKGLARQMLGLVHANIRLLKDVLKPRIRRH